MTDVSPDRFLNRELSWLEFNRRVLDLSRDADRPLLERAKFLAIFSRNLDEYFQVRVAGLQDQADGHVGAVSPDGLSPATQLARIRERVCALSAEAQAIFAQEIRPDLADAGLTIVGWEDLDDAERALARKRLETDLGPVLVPLAVDPTHPFPYVSGLSLNVGAAISRRGQSDPRIARVKVPPFARRLWELSTGRFLFVEEGVAAMLEDLFPGDEILASGFFRVTRDADLELREQESVDLARDIEVGLRRRVRGSDAVRMEVSAGLPERVRDFLERQLRLEADEVYEAEGPLDLGALWELQDLERPDLKDPSWKSRPVFSRWASQSNGDAVFRRLRDGDVLVHHPYESFVDSVERFMQVAANDPAVRVVMATLYRTGGPESGIVQALELAAERGKQVVVLVELKARFEEAANLERARSLERAGAHVVYGLVGLKTHAKLTLVVRAEAGGLRRYCHVGTGNYNPVTAKVYEDLGLFTASPEIGHEVAELFARLTSGSGDRRYERLLVAPDSLRSGLLRRIEQEARAPDGHIVMKLNSLSDPEIIDALTAAALGGTRVDLLVRGVCCLRPPPSRPIVVRSIVGRFLEHSRIFRFGSSERGRETWIGSADCMPRNLDVRVEVLVPVLDPAQRERLDELLELCLSPEMRAWELDSDGCWERTDGRELLHEHLLARYGKTPVEEKRRAE